MAFIDATRSGRRSRNTTTTTTPYTTEELMNLPTAVQKGLYDASQGTMGSELQSTAQARLGGAKLTPSGSGYGVLPQYASEGLTELSMRINAGQNVTDAEAKALASKRNTLNPTTFQALQSRIAGELGSSNQTGSRSGSSNQPLGGGSDGSQFGSAGAGYNPGGTTYQYDSAGNRILGKLGGKNVITGGGGVDRSAGVAGQMGGVFDPSYWVNREQDIRRQVERERQGQIDAINARYEGQVRREEEAGQQVLARQRSMNLRAGLGGSDFGAANKAEVRNRTSANIRDIQANQDIAVGQVIDQIETIANQRYQNEFTVANQSFQNQMAFAQFQQTQQDSARSLVKELGASGLDMATIKEKDPQLYQNIIQSSGLGEVQAEYLMNSAKKAASKVDYQWQLAGNTVIGFGIDPMTGEIKQVKQELDIEIPKNYSVSFAPDGTMMMVPDRFDPNIPAEQQIKTAGNYAKPESASGSGLTPYQQFQATQNLKKTTANMTSAQREIVRQTDLMNTAWANVEKNPKSLNAESQAIVTTWNKLLDPTSVVRESEYDRTPQGQAFIDMITGKIAALEAGGPGLTPENLKAVVDLGNQFRDSAMQYMTTKKLEARQEAAFFQLNPDFVTGQLEARELAEYYGYDYDAMVGQNFTDEDILFAITQEQGIY